MKQYFFVVTFRILGSNELRILTFDDHPRICPGLMVFLDDKTPAMTLSVRCVSTSTVPVFDNLVEGEL